MPTDLQHPSPKSNTREPLLVVENLSVDYVTQRGTVRAVDNLSFELARGEVLGLAGESGSGKSTAAMGMLRLLPPPAVISGGRVLFDGADVFDLSEQELANFRWRKIAVVFQSAMNALNPVLSIGSQICDVIRTHERIGREAARSRATDLLRLVGIPASRLDAYPHELSGGMRQRVVIAIALSLEPEVLLMDEPTTALDVVLQKEILQQIAELKDELGFSILFITHDLSLMLEFCDRIAVLYAGRLAEVAPAKALLQRPMHPYTRGLMHSFPDLHGSEERQTGIGGVPPDMLHPPSGCRFHPRCPDAVEGCRSQVPELLEMGPRHRAACLRATPYVGISATPTPSEDDGVWPLESDRPTAPDLPPFVDPPVSTSERETSAPPHVRNAPDPREALTAAPPAIRESDDQENPT